MIEILILAGRLSGEKERWLNISHLISALLILITICLLIYRSDFSFKKKNWMYAVSLLVMPGIGFMVYAWSMHEKTKEMQKWKLN